MRLFIEVSYLGKNYHGWQIQPNAITIQEMLEDGLSKLSGKPVRIHGSSRTDSGVHARQQFAHVDLEELPMKPGDLVWKMNSFLPADISVIRIIPVSQEAHSRFDAISRKYIYRISMKKNVFRIEDVLYFRKEPDVKRMNEAAQIVFQHTDFQCFSKVKTDVNNFDCEIMEAEWQWNEDILEFHIKANRFLRGMVRAIVGTLLDVGLGKMNSQEFENIILSKSRNRAGVAAEAHGLTLEEVNYPEKYFIS